MKNMEILSLCNKIQGWKTRLKELHWSAPSHSLHTVLDDFNGVLLEWEDTIMEDAQSMFGFIEAGDLEPQSAESLEAEALLVEIKKEIADFLGLMSDITMWTGIRSETETFFHEICKTIYLVKICKKEKGEA